MCKFYFFKTEFEEIFKIICIGRRRAYTKSTDNLGNETLNLFIWYIKE